MSGVDESPRLALTSKQLAAQAQMDAESTSKLGSFKHTRQSAGMFSFIHGKGNPNFHPKRDSNSLPTAAVSSSSSSSSSITASTPIASASSSSSSSSSASGLSLSLDQEEGLRRKARYVKIKKKGDSLFGWVHLYIDTQDGNNAVAVKRSSLELLRQGRTRHGTVAHENPVKEAYVLKLLQSKRICAPIYTNPTAQFIAASQALPNVALGARFIVGLLDLFQDDKYLWTVLQYAHGGDFFSYFQANKRLSMPLTKLYFAQLCLGMRFMHSCIPVEDEILTRFGFVNCQQMKALIQQHGEVPVASYDPVNDRMVYEIINKAGLVESKTKAWIDVYRPEEMQESADGSQSDCSENLQHVLRLSPDHLVWVEYSTNTTADGNYEFPSKRFSSLAEHIPKKANEVRMDADNLLKDKDILAYRFTSAASFNDDMDWKENCRDITSDPALLQSCPYLAALYPILNASDCFTQEQENAFMKFPSADINNAIPASANMKKKAFLQLYGGWLGDSKLSKGRALWSPAAPASLQWIIDRLKMIGIPFELNESEQYVECLDTCMNAFFTAEHDNSPAPKLSWMRLLSALQKRYIIEGLIRANENVQDWIDHGKIRISTASELFRDQLIQLLMEAGYSSHYSVQQEFGAAVTAIVSSEIIAARRKYIIHGSENLRKIVIPMDKKEKEYIRRVELQDEQSTWCVRLPELSSKRIFVRRAPLNGRCNAATVVNNCGVCHLDLSFENVLMDERKQCLITDLGLCESIPVLQHNIQSPNGQSMLVLVEQLFPAGPRAGKAVYLPPEIYTQQTFYGRAADLWSLGIMLFLCLAGADHVPFKKPLETEAGFQWVFGGRLRDLIVAWKLSEYFDDGAVDLLNHLLCPLHKRYKSVDEMMMHPWLRDEIYRVAALIEQEEKQMNEEMHRRKLDQLKEISAALVQKELAKPDKSKNESDAMQEEK